MSGNLSTSVIETTFDSVLAEFEKPKEETSAPSFMSPKAESAVLSEPIKKEEEKKDPIETLKTQNGGTPVETKLEKVDVKDIDTVLERPDKELEDEMKDKPSSLLTVLQDLATEEVIFPFEGDKPISEYTAEDVKELIKLNLEHHKKEALNSEIGEFFESLPAELQYAAKYVADGGTDMKSLFRALAATEEIRNLDTKNMKDRESIIREYYRAIEWGDEKEINEEVERVKELGESELEKLATKFKPKLEKMHEEVTVQQLQRQERAKQLQQQEMEAYLENAHEAIKGGKIDGITLDKKTQAGLWAGLTQPSYQTRRGSATNELGHLLEKYQYTEPNFEIMYEVLWLLRDRAGFKEAMSKQLKNEVTSETVRVLKTEQGKKTGPGQREEIPSAETPKKKVLQRSSPNFMSGLGRKE